MRLKKVTRRALIWLSMMTSTTGGCNDGALEVAREAAERQARQNEAMAELQSHVAAGAERLIEEESQARRQALDVQRRLQAERATLAGGWNDLEAARQSMARSRRTDSFLTALVAGGGSSLAALVALSFAWLALFGLKRDEQAAHVACQLLMDDLVADRPWRRAAADPNSAGAQLPPPQEHTAADAPAWPTPAPSPLGAPS